MNSVIIECPNYKSQMEVAFPKRTSLFNGPTVTVGAVAHEKPIICAGCSQYFVLAATRVFFDWSIVPITQEQAADLEDSPIIVPQAGVLSLVP